MSVKPVNQKVIRHREICKELNALFERKNHDYGDSFHRSFLEEGLAMARIRLGDKYNRFKTLSRQDSDQQVDDESIRDTLIDLANYAIMTVMELDLREKDGKELDRYLRIKLDPTEKELRDPLYWHTPSEETRTYHLIGAGSPQDATQGLSGEGGSGTHPLKKITVDDVVEAYRRILEDAKEETRSALDRVIAASGSEEETFEAEIVEKEKNKLLEGPYIGENERRSFDLSTDWE